MRFFAAIILALLWLIPVAVRAQTDGAHHGSISGAYEYLDAQGANGTYTSLHGFDAVAALAMSRNADIFCSLNGFYKNNQHVNGFTGGPLYKLHSVGRVTPLGFTEIGDSRASLNGVVIHAFTFVLGGGVLVKLNQHVSLQLIPAEYVMTLPHGNVANNFNAVAGFTFPVGHRNSEHH